MILILLSLILFSWCDTELTELGVKVSGELTTDVKAVQYKIKIDTLFKDLSNAEYGSVTVTILAGEADMFIARMVDGYPSESYCSSGADNCYHSYDVFGDIIDISRKDDQIVNHEGDYLKIVVYEPKHTPYSETKFDILPYNHKNPIHMPMGETIVVSCVGKQWFQWNVNRSEALTVSLTPAIGTGDPDIYASGVNDHPTEDTPANQTYHEMRLDYDVVKASPGESAFGLGTWGATVYSINEESFAYSLGVSHDDEYLIIPEGTPIGDSVATGGDQYYKFYLPKIASGNHKLQFSLNNKWSYGDPDIYVNGPNKEDEPKPSKKKHEYYAHEVGRDILTIDNPQVGWYKICVHGYEAGIYSLTALTEDSIQLIPDGAAPIVSFVVEGNYNYFKFGNIDEKNRIYIVVSVESGDVSLYGSNPSKNNPRPTKKKKNWIGIESGKLRYYVIEPNSEIGDYYFSVYGETNSNFTVRAMTNQSIAILRDNEQILFNSVAKGSYRYYMYDREPTETGPLTLTVQPWQGEADLYVSNDVKFPNENEFTWMSNKVGADSITIWPDDKKITGSTFYIGVKGSTYFPNNFYTILGFSSSQPYELSKGKSIGGSVKKGKFLTYKFYVMSKGTINIVATKSDSSDVIKFYVKKGEDIPSPMSHDYESTSFNTEYAEFTGTKGYYHIAVYGIGSSTKEVKDIPFDIVWTSGVKIINANLETSQIVSKEMTTEQVKVDIPSGTKYVIVSSPLIHGATQLYINFNDTNPQPGKAAFHEDSWPGVVSLIPSNYPGFKDGNTWSVGVYSTEFSNYFVSVDTLPPYVFGSKLFESIPRLTRLPVCREAPCADYIKFYFPIDDGVEGKVASKSAFVSIRVISGSTGVYVGQDGNVDPSPDSYQWKAESSSDIVIEMLPEGEKEQLKNGWVFVTCRGLHVSTETILEVIYYREDSPVFVNQDQSFISDLVTKKRSYFTAMAVQAVEAETQYPSTIYLESCDNHAVPDFYINVKVRGKQKNPHPEPGLADQMSEEEIMDDQIGCLRGRAVLEKYSHPELYYIMAEGIEDQVVSMFVTSNGDSRPVLSNENLKQGKKTSGKNFNLLIPTAKPSERFPHRVLVYKIFTTQITITGGKPEKVNFNTACAVELHGNLIGEIHGSSEDEYLSFPMDVSKSVVNKINVIVQDNYGLSSIYQEAWIAKGKLYSTFPNLSVHYVWYLGWIFIILFFIVVTLYFVIGIIVNFARGKRQFWDIIPQGSFWKALPGFVWDGIMFVLTCFRRSHGKTYKEMDDDEDAYTDNAGSINTPSKPDDSGYGTI